MSQVQTSTSAPLTSKQAFRQLKIAKVANGTGAIKATISGRGNEFVRESGQIVKIYNTTLFPTKEASLEASAAYKLGIEAEMKGDAASADQHFRLALNKRLSFSIPQDWANAVDYDTCFEVIGMIEEVDSKQNPGTTVWTLNRVRPVSVGHASDAGSLFEAAPLPAAAPNVMNQAREAVKAGK